MSFRTYSFAICFPDDRTYTSVNLPFSLTKFQAFESYYDQKHDVTVRAPTAMGRCVTISRCLMHVSGTEISFSPSVWRVGEGAAPAPAPAPVSLPASALSHTSKPSLPPPSFRDIMRLDSMADDDSLASPQALPQSKHHALTDFDIETSAPDTSAAAAAASQGERLLKQMQEKAASGEGRVIGAKVLMAKASAAPAVKQVKRRVLFCCVRAMF